MSASDEMFGPGEPPDDLGWEDDLDFGHGDSPYDEAKTEPGGSSPSDQASRSGGINRLGQAGAAVAGNVGGGVRVLTAGDHGVALSAEHVSFLVGADDEILTRFNIGRTAKSWKLDGSGLWARFVPPEGYENAVMQLRGHKVVLLTGEEGSGRSAAAMMALLAAAGCIPTTAEERAEAGNTASCIIRDLPTFQEIQRDALNWPGPGEITPGERLRLHLPTAPASGSVIDGALQSLIKAVRDRSAWLAVVVSEEVLRMLPPEWDDFRVRLGRPDPAAVLARHLSTVHERWPATDPHGETQSQIYAADSEGSLTAISMEKIARVAQAALPEGPPSHWLPAALQATVGNPARLVDELRENSGASRSASDGAAIEWRLRLAAVAMLEGATTAMVVRAERELVRACATSGRPADEEHPFAWDEADEWLGRVGAVRIEDATPGSSTVKFRRPVYGIAARRYLWIEHPHLVETYLNWFDRLAAGFPRTTEAGREMTVLLAARIAEQMLLSVDADGLLWLAEHWSRRSGAVYSTASALALRLGIENDGTAPRIRRQFYEWSRQEIHPGLARIVIRSCGGPLADTRPDMAVTRLLHFLGSAEDLVADAAARSLVRLAEREGNYRLVLERVLALTSTGRSPSYMAEPTGGTLRKESWRDRKNRRASLLFVRLADPELLTQKYRRNSGESRDPTGPSVWESSGLAQDLARAWEAALSWPLGDEVLVRRVADWLDAATMPGDTDWPLDVLAAACGARGQLRKRLCNLVFEASRTAARRGGTPGPRAAYTRLLEKVAHSSLNRMGAML
jgi:hypothetical protein